MKSKSRRVNKNKLKCNTPKKSTRDGKKKMVVIYVKMNLKEKKYYH